MPAREPLAVFELGDLLGELAQFAADRGML